MFSLVFFLYSSACSLTPVQKRNDSIYKMAAGGFHDIVVPGCRAQQRVLDIAEDIPVASQSRVFNDEQASGSKGSHVHAFVTVLFTSAVSLSRTCSPEERWHHQCEGNLACADMAVSWRSPVPPYYQHCHCVSQRSVATLGQCEDCTDHIWEVPPQTSMFEAGITGSQCRRKPSFVAPTVSVSTHRTKGGPICLSCCQRCYATSCCLQRFG